MGEGAGSDRHLRQRQFQCQGQGGQYRLKHRVEWKRKQKVLSPELLSVGPNCQPALCAQTP